MNKGNATGRVNRIIKMIICVLIMAAMLVCLSGCRDRITNRADADRETIDKTGTMAADYEKRRDELDLKEAVKSLMKNKKRPEKKEEQKEEKKQSEEKSKGSNDNDTKDAKVDQKKKSKNNNSDKDNSNGTKGGKKKGQNGDGPGGDQPGESGQSDPAEGDPIEERASKVLVAFDPNEGKCVPANDDSREYTSGKEYGSFPNATRDDHTFTGWYTEKDGGTAVTEKSIVPEGEHTLYAHWTKAADSSGKNEEVYTLTFDPCDGRIKNRERTREISLGSAYGNMPLPVKTGNDFLGWFTKKDGGQKISENDEYKEKGNQTLYAHWEYNPYKYWSSMRLTIYESMYACQVVDCYIEFDDNKTTTSCSLLSDAKIGNCARNRGSNTTVTDEWIEGRNPAAIIKCKGSPSQAASIKSSMAERFPDRRILVVPSSAVNGNDHERLFYTLALGKAIYPSWFEEIDLDKAGSELGVSGSVYE